MTPYRVQPILHWSRFGTTPKELPLIGEEPLSIRIEGKPYSVVLRTPGDEIAHAAGFCLSEGIVEQPGDIRAIAICDDMDTNVVTITLSDERRPLATRFLERRGFISQTSCGLCGKEIIDELQMELSPFKSSARVSAGAVSEALDNLYTHQPQGRITRSTHAAVLLDAALTPLSAGEDVGRHNAVDKAVGRLFLEDRLASAKVLLLSSRISYELIQKAARARVPIVFAISRPTTLAVALAERLGMTLACLAPDGNLFIFCGADRLDS